MGSGNGAIILERRFLPEGTSIVRQEEDGTCAFLIQSGKVRIYSTSPEGQEIDLAFLGAGEIFGETALIFDIKRSASAVAETDCNLVLISRQTFRKKLENSDPTVQAIVEMLTRRVMDANAVLTNKKTDFKDLTETVRVIYENIQAGLSRENRRTFENIVLPRLDDFMSAVRDFQARCPVVSKNPQK